ncbi:unnamed protein product [Rotaria magnacalcarata]
MPQKSRRSFHSQFTISGLWEHQDESQLQVQELSAEEEKWASVMEVDDEKERNESKGVDGENFNLKLDLPMIGDLFEMCKSFCGPRNLSTLIYTILRYLGLSWRRADDLLRSIGANTCETAHKWAEIFISGDIEIFQAEGRGAAKAFAIKSCSRKLADFTAVDLANFIDTTFYELTQTSKLNDTLGRERSHMISDFIVQHPCGPFFSLSDVEYDKAVEKFPSLSSSDDLNYVQNSATAGINVGVEGYFNNEVILSQFERLFQLVSFKQDFEGHQFEVVVDNARTYSAREYSINEFNKGIGTKRPVDSITYVDDKGKVISISCRFTTGDHRGKTKENGALAGRYCDQPAQFRHRNMYLISKDHLSLETRRTILTNLQRMADEKLNRLTNEYDRKVLELTQQKYLTIVTIYIHSQLEELESQLNNLQLDTLFQEWAATRDSSRSCFLQANTSNIENILKEMESNLTKANGNKRIEV